MITKSSKIYLAGIIFLMILTESCKEKEVIITKDYVINPYWDKVDNSFTVTKMIFRDRGDNINLKNASASELLGKLVEDTSFSLVTNVKYNGEDYSKRKVYFNQYNGFSWGKLNDRHSNYVQETVGQLQQDTWYLLGGLGDEKTLYYLCLDTLDSLHTVKVPASAWTNY